MKIGFYAPMKPPDHPVPSGDRHMSRSLVRVLEACGHDVEILSRLRTHDSRGDAAAQEKIRRLARAEIRRLEQRYARLDPPDLVFTYHVYHKAPDWIGAELANTLRVPYVIAEASYAPGQAGGPWAEGHAQAENCIRAAACIISINPRDNACVAPLLRAGQAIHALAPFLAEDPPVPDRGAARNRLSRLHGLDPDPPWIITVAMAREGDKAESYRRLAQALAGLADVPWRMVCIGGGGAMADVKAGFRPISARCLFTGELAPDDVWPWLAAADLYAWPSVNEAYGMALLEAQAAGLPAVVQDYGGVGTIVRHHSTGLVTQADRPAAYASAIRKLLLDPGLRRRMAEAARNKALTEHSFTAARVRMREILACLC